MLVIDIMSRTPVYEQIIKQVEEQVLVGMMKAGEKMPSVRSLSINLSINPNTIQKAYTELDRRGLIVTVPGKGSFISEEAAGIVGEKSRNKINKLTEIVEQMAYAGIAKEEIIAAVNEIYEKMSGESND